MVLICIASPLLGIGVDKMRQLIATSVVSAFTETNVHKDLASFIPTLLITPTCGIISIYDVENDFLLISDPFVWVEKTVDGLKLDKEGCLILWLVVNYR